MIKLETSSYVVEIPYYEYYLKQPELTTHPLLIHLKCFYDNRGWFKESFRKNEIEEFLKIEFVQDNVSMSYKGGLRGLHYDYSVAKLLQILSGKTYHVIVDMNENSMNYKTCYYFNLSEYDHKLLYIPTGFANGWYTLENKTIVSYKQSAYFLSQTENLLKWNNSEINIKWPIDLRGAFIISEKDK